MLHDEAAKNLYQSGSFNLDYVLTAFNSYADKENFFLKNNFFDKLAGTDQLRKQIKEGKSLGEIRASWQPGLEKFYQIRDKYLLYE